MDAMPRPFEHVKTCEAGGASARAAVPWQVRRAEAYIEAHWDQAITVETLAEVAGTSARTLFHAFKLSRGQSPMAFVKQVRLARARQMLENPHLRCSVSSVAFACGFGNLGHFARDYAQRFGETPSRTLGRAKLRWCAGHSRPNVRLAS
jgi:transcriptional regulator GlxA family with amidase domain